MSVAYYSSGFDLLGALNLNSTFPFLSSDPAYQLGELIAIIVIMVVILDLLTGVFRIFNFLKNPQVYSEIELEEPEEEAMGFEYSISMVCKNCGKISKQTILKGYEPQEAAKIGNIFCPVCHSKN